MLQPKERFIFYHFVRCYLKKNRPIGSKYLAKTLNFKFSPPLLRLYFRRLAKKGLILNSYDFKGRLPSDKGWKYYLFGFNLNPEIKLNYQNLEESIKKYLYFSRSALIVIEENRKSFLKGLNYLADGLAQKKESLVDALDLIEYLLSTFDLISEDIGIKIGKEIKISKTGELALGFVNQPKRSYLFLGPKRNYYHTLWSLLNEIKKRI
ncbi:Heat-inducible transcription repressor HrcA [bacterium HR35]|nr:Heat-inducible transcription repressor HrcA [bacterium HR35]